MLVSSLWNVVDLFYLLHFDMASYSCSNQNYSNYILWYIILYPRDKNVQKL